MGYGEGIGL